jgi:hypothetical protein
VLAQRGVAPVLTLDDALAADVEARALACSALGIRNPGSGIGYQSIGAAA